MNTDKIAVATDGTVVAEHFGRCPQYTLFEVVGDGIESEIAVPNPGHQPGFLPGYLRNLGVTCVMAGGMGMRAQALFADQGIATVVGVRGLVRDVVQSYLDGTLSLGESTCRRDDDEHSCAE